MTAAEALVPSGGEASVKDRRREELQDNEPPLKKVKTDKNDPVSRITDLGFNDADRFVQGQKLSSMAESYATYKHVVIPDLFNPELLKSVCTEILTHLHFTPKQTDIYSVSQTGDLANLSGLPSAELEALPSLLQLRNALYSQEFRDFLCTVTGVKALSGTKTDMSINSYEKGGYLLTHDDVIGTRSVSFILYLVQGDVEGGWKEEWGGGLRLYNTSEDGVPENEPCLTIPPKWNQMSMFGNKQIRAKLSVAVQPGKSFHDVEEVYTSESPRLAISGWFHVPQEGEAGYLPPDSTIEDKALSSLQQLTSIAEDKIWSFSTLPEVSEYDFEESDLDFLSKWINEAYLTPDVVEQMREAMAEEFVLELPDFLNPDKSRILHTYLSEQDKSPNNEGWQIAGPPHKQRFRYIRTSFTPEHNLIDLFQHPAFRKWLYHATGLELTSQRAIARHFRPGSDYTLATEHTSPMPNLEATLSLTPSAMKVKPSTKAKGIGARAALVNRETGWENGEFGGYEVYLASNQDDEADPAVYKTADEGDDGILLSQDAKWNHLTLAVRDQGTLKFVKYVSRSAWEGRWDVTSEWTTKEEAEDVEEEEVEETAENDENEE